MTGNEDQKTHVDELYEAYELELNKVLLSHNLDYFRNLLAVLNGITGILLAAQVRIVSTLSGSLTDGASQTFALTPIILFGVSLVLGFISVVASPGHDYTVGDLESTQLAYDRAISNRRQKLIAPAVTTAVGIVVMVYFALSR